MVAGLIITFIIVIILIFVLIFYNSIYAFFDKKFFNRQVSKKIYKIAKDYDYYLLNNVAIDVEGRTIHFNHILFGDKYIYCIVEYFYPNAISGKFNDSSWYRYKGNAKRVIIKNPMILNRERIKYFASRISATEDLFVAAFIVNNSCLIDDIEGCSNNDRIINLSQLNNLIKEFESKDDVGPIEPEMLSKLVKKISNFCE